MLPSRLSRLSIVIAAAAASLCIALFARGVVRAEDVDLDVVFRCHGPQSNDYKNCIAARELVLQNCTVCHTFVPIVMQQFDSAGWDGLLDRHRPRVPQLSERQVAFLHDFLTVTFNPDNEPPELPEALLKTWTAY